MEVLQQSFSKSYYIVTRNEKTRKLQAIEEAKALELRLSSGVGVFASTKKEAVEKVRNSMQSC